MHRALTLLRFLLYSFTLGLLSGCGQEVPHQAAAPLRRDNYVVLLDLSDRLLQPGQVSRDTALLGQVLATYQAGVAQKLYVGSADRLKLVVAPQRSQSAAVQQLSQGLYLDLEKVPLGQRRQLAGPLQQLRRQVSALYLPPQLLQPPPLRRGRPVALLPRPAGAGFST
jgi:hypothetical protein